MNSSTGQPKQPDRHRIIRILLSLAAVVFICIIAYFVGRPLISLVSEPEKFREWVEARGIWGVLAFMGMVIVQVFLAVIPAAPLRSEPAMPSA